MIKEPFKGHSQNKMIHFNQNRFRNIAESLIVLSVSACSLAQLKADLPLVGGEFPVAPSLIGDQVNSHIALGNNGGYLVWEDSAADGNETGIVAARLNSNVDLEYEVFSVNTTTAGSQTNPKVALTGNSGALFVWENSGDIYGRFLNEEGYFSGEDFRINSYEEDLQQNACVATLANGNIAVVWESDGQDGHRKGVFGQIFASDGSPVGAEFGVNQNTYQNQRTPSVLATRGNQLFIAWVSESPVDGTGSNFGVCVWGRYFSADGIPVGDEVQLTQTSLLAANPALSQNEAGDIALVFSGLPNPALQVADLSGTPPSWAVNAVVINELSNAPFASTVISGRSENDQAVPLLVSSADRFLSIWTGFGGAGSGSDVYGGIFDASLSIVGSPAILNTSIKSLQYMPSASVDVNGNIVAIWSSYVGGIASFDLIGQRFGKIGSEPAESLPDPAAPFVFGLGFNEIGVSWPNIEGFDVSHYEVFLGKSSEGIETTDNHLVISDLAIDSSYEVQIRYVSSGGTKSAKSPVGIGKTWDNDSNEDGLPDTFQQTYWGYNEARWGSAFEDSDNDGSSNLEELLAGTNPLSNHSYLGVSLEKTGGTIWVVWEANPGAIYQVQHTGDLESWNNFGGPRFAHNGIDRVALDAEEAQKIYRVIRLN
jgi:hypothetical protein